MLILRVPFSVPLLLAHAAAQTPQALPIADLTTTTAFADAARGAPPPPLADDAARSFPLDPSRAPRKGYDPAPLWLDRLFASLGARPRYVVRERTFELAPCDARDMRCQQMHDDLARLEPQGASASLVASGLGTALGLMFGGKDRALGRGISFRARGRFIGLVGEW